MKARSWFTLVAAAVLSACGGGSSGMGSGGCTPGTSAAVGIGSAGFNPVAVCILPSGTVKFTNNDSVAHDIEASTNASACTSLNLGSIAAGQSVSPSFGTAAVCTFHDAAHASDTAFQGTVAVSNAPVSGGGY